MLSTTGNVNGALEHVHENDFFANADNHTEPTHERFIHEVVSDLAGNQSDIRGVLLEHMKRDVSYDNPDNNLARARDIFKML